MASFKCANSFLNGKSLYHDMNFRKLMIFAYLKKYVKLHSLRYGECLL